MNQTERRIYLVKELLKEQENRNLSIPENENEQKHLLRSLMNVRMPASIGQKFLKIQDEYLQQAVTEKGITDIRDLQPVCKDIYLWQGDITTLRCDAIVNAANSQMLGCFYPCHGCIDNAIHTYAGIQLRLECAELMKQQGHNEEAGKAKITSAYNLPCKYVLHTVGPVVFGNLTVKDEKCWHPVTCPVFLWQRKRIKQYCVLLYFHRGISFFEPTGCRDCGADGSRL